MRRISCLLLVACLGVACAKQSVLPRTLWERKTRTERRRLQTNLGVGAGAVSTEELRELLTVNEGSAAAFGGILQKMVQSINFDMVSHDIALGNQAFEKMFGTFKILQQAPAYKAAVANVTMDLKDPKTQARVLIDSITQFSDLALNLRVAMDSDKAAPGGIHGEVLKFLQNADEPTLKMAERVQQGDSRAITELQQAFFDSSEKYNGLQLKDLADDDFVRASRDFLKNDAGLQSLMNNEENTLDLLLDENLLFANNPIFNGQL